jgi:hypothetical protein
MLSTPKPKVQVPKRFAAGVRVKTRGKNTRIGTIVKATGKSVWEVKFDDGSTEVRKSQQLQIYEEYYNKPPEPTSMQKAISTIKRILPKTVGRRRGARARTRNSISSSNSSSESQSDEYSTSSSRDKDEDFEPEVGILDSPEADGVETVLLTPRAFTPSPGPGQPSRPRTLFGEEQAPEEDDDRRSNHSFDDCLEDEEDIRLPSFSLEDGGEDQCDFVDVPQRLQEYQNATKLMNAKKKELMGTTITKIVKPGNKYAPGGLVEGRPKTVKEGQKGTIVEEVEDGVYEIEWDDLDLPNCQVEKRHLRLQTGLTQTYTWKFVEHHVANNPPTEYRKHGLIGLSSKGLEVPPTIPNKDNPEEPLPNPEYDHPFARLVEQLWPGDWRDQLSNLNKHIATESKGIKQVDTNEWWTFWGIMAFAGGAGVGGEEKLWKKEVELLKELPKIDLSVQMKLYRFKQLKKLMPNAFAGKDKQDPWHPIIAMMIGFNNSRAQDIAASYQKVFDESMSSWRARTTQLGGLPFLSFVLRKPKPLGTEFKVVADAETGKCKHIFNQSILCCTHQ